MKALVTGGGGFLGYAIVTALLQRGYEVNTIQRRNYPALNKTSVVIHRGDIADPDAVIHASKSCDVVFHVAGKTGVWGNYNDYYHTNVIGTECVINACQKNNINRLVYTSSPSVVFDGNDEENINESVPYPSNYLTHYQKTKAIAEQKVLSANNTKLATIALRPHLIWGKNDPHLIARIINRAKSGKLRLVGTRNNLVDSTYIDNAVIAHLLAADVLVPGAACAGKPYFISNGEPLVMADLINQILVALGEPPVSKTISPYAAYLIGGGLELIYKMFRIKDEPMMTRFIAKQLSCAHWYNISAAKKDLGYEPEVTIKEGLQRL